MELKIQIISFIYSFIYGIILYIIFVRIKKYFYLKNNIYNILNSFMFNFIATIIYYKGHYYINNANINIYFLLITLSTFFYLNYTRFTKKM